MRKVKDAKDLNSNELIYFKGHAKATYMSDGTTVEDAINNIEVGDIDLSDYAKKSDLSTVATSGSYDDLINKPTIPNAVSESTVSDWGFTKNEGTITGVSANGTSISTSGVANIPAASTSAYGVTKLSSSTSSTSTTLAATASAVKSAYDLANGKQDKLVSGTNIKTINGTSILGSGDIVISGSGEGSSSNSNAYPLVNHNSSITTVTLTPNTFHVWEHTDLLTLTLGEEIPNVMNEYLFQVSFIAGCTLSLPSSIIWANDDIPEFDDMHIFQISIVNNCATYLKFKI